MYESTTYVYYISKNGSSKRSTITLNNLIKKNGMNMFKKIFKEYNCDAYQRNIFKVKCYENLVYLNGMWNDYVKLKNSKKKEFLLTGNNFKGSIKIKKYKDMSIKFYDLNGSCDHKNTEKFIKEFGKERKMPKNNGFGKIEKKNKITLKTNFPNVLMIGSEDCVYCKRAKEKLLKTNYNYEIIVYDTINEAFEHLSKIDKSIKTIPAFFMNGKYIENYSELF